jgi:hypothetical protein
MSSRKFPIHPKIARSMAPEYTPSRMQNELGLRICFEALGAYLRRKPEMPLVYT